MQKTLFDAPEQSFHNTISLNGNDLKQAEAKARTQEELVMDYFEIPRQSISGETAEDVYDYLLARGWINYKTPLTSIRRAITNLCKQGKLEKLSDMKPGSMGKPIHVYRKKNVEL